MSVTAFQGIVCRLLADERKRCGESYVAGGVPLSIFSRSKRLSKDLDIFHDTSEALDRSCKNDVSLLESSGYNVVYFRNAPSFVGAIVSKGDERLKVEWVRDSAYRFFPLVEHTVFGLTAHPFDLATNKVLALGGRMEVKDWVDTIYASDSIQHLGFLVYSACGKDPGYSPASLLGEAGRSSKYSLDEYSEIEFDGEKPDFLTLVKRWKKVLSAASEIVEALPPEEAGKCVLGKNGCLYDFNTVDELRRSAASKNLEFRGGCIGGVLPNVLKI
jgi:hypothetical protein